MESNLKREGKKGRIMYVGESEAASVIMSVKYMKVECTDDGTQLPFLRGKVKRT